uniref:Uncharacterized protein n=1 Tax=Lactuca sativa TaxID=4236 RepID=A0A9R1XJI7_LACSA|nr:hypothetical protein LSAT_V11C300139980 [Lactuca sativa]
MIGDVAANYPDETAENQQQEKPWHSYIYEDLPHTVQESADSAVRSARSLQQNSSTHIRTLKSSCPYALMRICISLHAISSGFFIYRMIAYHCDSIVFSMKLSLM